MPPAALPQEFNGTHKSGAGAGAGAGVGHHGAEGKVRQGEASKTQTHSKRLKSILIGHTKPEHNFALPTLSLRQHSHHNSVEKK